MATILEQWRDMAYSPTANKGDLQRLWKAYFLKEKEILSVHLAELRELSGFFRLSFGLLGLGLRSHSEPLSLRHSPYYQIDDIRLLRHFPHFRH